MRKKITYISIGIFGVIFFYGIYIMTIKNRLIQEKGRYTIGVIHKTKVGSKGIRVFINYTFDNKTEEVDYIEEYMERDKLTPGRRIFIKFIPGEDIKYIKLHLDCIVPDSIKNAPLHGWSELWMKENFSDYLELIRKS